jgi:hypothetical protein
MRAIIILILLAVSSLSSSSIEAQEDVENLYSLSYRNIPTVEENSSCRILRGSTHMYRKDQKANVLNRFKGISHRMNKKERRLSITGISWLKSPSPEGGNSRAKRGKLRK